MRFKSMQNACLLAGALALVPVQAFAAQTGAAKCLSRTQGEALIVNMLPAAIGGISEKCRSVLGGSAYLMNMDSKVAQEFGPAADAAWPTASTAFATIIGADLPEGLDIAVFRPIVEATLVEMLINEVKTDSCPAINNIMESLDPLPPASLGRLFVAIHEASGEGNDNDSGFAICKTVGN